MYKTICSPSSSSSSSPPSPTIASPSPSSLLLPSPSSSSLHPFTISFFFLPSSLLLVPSPSPTIASPWGRPHHTSNALSSSSSLVSLPAAAAEGGDQCETHIHTYHAHTYHAHTYHAHTHAHTYHAHTYIMHMHTWHHNFPLFAHIPPSFCNPSLSIPSINSPNQPQSHAQWPARHTPSHTRIVLDEKEERDAMHILPVAAALEMDAARARWVMGTTAIASTVFFTSSTAWNMAASVRSARWRSIRTLILICWLLMCCRPVDLWSSN